MKRGQNAANFRTEERVQSHQNPPQRPSEIGSKWRLVSAENDVRHRCILREKVAARKTWSPCLWLFFWQIDEEQRLIFRRREGSLLLEIRQAFDEKKELEPR